SPVGKQSDVVRIFAAASSLLSDHLIRSTSTAVVYAEAFARIPAIPTDHPTAPAAILRTLRLNCLTDAYAALWKDTFSDAFTADAWTGGLERPNRPALGDVGPEWSMASPLRIDEDRRQALVEIDAIMAIVTGMSIDD